jgi:hypothetical protein
MAADLAKLNTLTSKTGTSDSVLLASDMLRKRLPEENSLSRPLSRSGSPHLVRKRSSYGDCTDGAARTGEDANEADGRKPLLQVLQYLSASNDSLAAASAHSHPRTQHSATGGRQRRRSVSPSQRARSRGSSHSRSRTPTPSSEHIRQELEQQLELDPTVHQQLPRPARLLSGSQQLEVPPMHSSSSNSSSPWMARVRP